MRKGCDRDGECHEGACGVGALLFFIRSPLMRAAALF